MQPMEHTWGNKVSTHIASTEFQYHAVETEQMQYQIAVFNSILKVVIGFCLFMTTAYFIPFVQQTAWGALIVSLTMLATSIYSIAAVRSVNYKNFPTLVRGWLVIATITVFLFGLVQPPEFLEIMALGAVVVILLAIFLESAEYSARWTMGIIAGYITVVFIRGTVYVPSFDLGILYPVVLYATPIIILIIVTEVGRITTQHFKINLIQSETQRRQLEIKEQELISYTIEVETARAKAERSDKVKSAFLASMSHELRTPLNAIINFTQFVIDGDTGDVNQEQHELLTDVVDSARHLLNLINDVLDMSKIEAGSLNLFVEKDVDLSFIIDRTISMGRSLLNDKPVELVRSIKSDLPLVECDQQRICQILLNLMSNACKFTQQGQIKIHAETFDGEVVISIADTGSGIALEDQEMIFSAFKQTNSGLRHGNGTGLGLAISKSLAEAHHGRLWVDSVPERGSKFSLSLPLKQQKSHAVLAN